MGDLAATGGRRAPTGCALLVLAASVTAFAAMDAAEPSVTVGGTASSLSVIAEGASLREVLEYVAHHQRLSVQSRVALDEPVRVRIVGQPLGTVIRRLLRDYNFTLQLAPQGASAGRLWVHPRGDGRARRLVAAERFGVDQAVDDRAAARRRLTHGDAAERLDGAAVLAAWGGDDAFVALADAALDDADPAVREEALAGLADHYPDESVPLVAMALSDPAAEVRAAALDALADIGSDEAVAWLGALLGAADAAERRRAVDVLGDIESRAASRQLERALGDPDEAVRQAAADYLAERR